MTWSRYVLRFLCLYFYCTPPAWTHLEHDSACRELLSDQTQLQPDIELYTSAWSTRTKSRQSTNSMASLIANSHLLFDPPATALFFVRNRHKVQPMHLFLYQTLSTQL